MRTAINLLQEWSIPLIVGVFVALIVANVAPDTYKILVDVPVTHWDKAFEDLEQHHATEHAEEAGEHAPAAEEHADHADHAHHTDHDETVADVQAAAEHHHDGFHVPHGKDAKKKYGWAYYITLHFLINDIFMVLFFGIAAKEIVEAVLPGGPLNPPSKAINPLLATLGGVLGPVGVFFALNYMMGKPGMDPATEWGKGWGIPTATDIALAWLVARMIFGNGHPAISFLLLLAVADDAIGLGIIAFGYPNPEMPTEWFNTIWIVPGMVVSYALRKMNVQNWIPYILVGGAFSWWGLYSAHLHPALALIPIVPFLPSAARDVGMFEEEADYEAREKHGHQHSPLETFEHQLKLPVDFGLFFFAFANAGVAFGALNNLTWIIFLSLLVGKIVGIAGFGGIGMLVGFPLPDGMKFKHLLVASIVAAIGLTVALFVCGQAFPPGDSQDAAKMGALFSGGISIIAIILGAVLGVKDKPSR